MHPIFRNILAIAAGVIIGGIVNMGMVMVGPMLIPVPAGVDVTNSESLAQNIHLFEFKHFIFPFLAHAVGTFIGALAAAWIASSRKMLFALIIGAFFIIGGIMNISMIPAPLTFNVIDLVFAYFPMAALGGYLMTREVK